MSTKRWALPDEPGPEVTAVRDMEGEHWVRRGRVWVCDGERVQWRTLFVEYGPLTDATGETA